MVHPRMDWRTELGKDNRGSRPRSVLLTDGSREQVAERLARLVDRPEVVLSSEDQWQPRGICDPREARLDVQLADGAILLSTERHRQLGDVPEQLAKWWLVVRRGKTPTWDIASTCTISGKNGLLLVEAKAHSEELNENDSSGAKGVNRRQIDRAVEEANAGLRALTSGPWALSTRHHYQLSNRFAWSWKLATLGVPVVLVYLGFLDAWDMREEGDPFQSGEDWRDTVLAYCRNVVDESCWDRTLDVGGVPLIPLVRVFEQPLEP